MIQQNNSMGAPFDPKPDEELPDDQESLTDDYLDDSVRDVELSWPDDNPEDAPAGGIDQLREAVRDDMPGGDSRDAIDRELHSPNEARNQYRPEYFDTEENVDADFLSPDGKTVEDEVVDDETSGDPPPNPQNFGDRVG